MNLKSACRCSVFAETVHSLANLVVRTFILALNLLFWQNVDNDKPFLLFAHFFQIHE
jgi:hypothetical protein